MDGGEIEKIEESTEEGGKDFSRGVKGYERRRFRRKSFFGRDKKMIFDEEVDT